jgi:transcriptional regulator with XRE-family HTH domain
MEKIFFCDKIQGIIDIMFKGSQSAFAKKIGVTQQTLNRNLNARDERHLMDHVGRILLALPEINIDWLLHDRGEMLRGEPFMLPGACAGSMEMENTELLRENRELLRENRDLRLELERLRAEITNFPIVHTGLGTVPTARTDIESEQGKGV